MLFCRECRVACAGRYFRRRLEASRPPDSRRVSRAGGGSMPTVFSHPAPVLALAAALGSRVVPARLLLFGVFWPFFRTWT